MMLEHTCLYETLLIKTVDFCPTESEINDLTINEDI